MRRLIAAGPTEILRSKVLLINCSSSFGFFSCLMKMDRNHWNESWALCELTLHSAFQSCLQSRQYCQIKISKCLSNIINTLDKLRNTRPIIYTSLINNTVQLCYGGYASLFEGPCWGPFQSCTKSPLALVRDWGYSINIPLPQWMRFFWEGLLKFFFSDGGTVSVLLTFFLGESGAGWGWGQGWGSGY